MLLSQKLTQTLACSARSTNNMQQFNNAAAASVCRPRELTDAAQMPPMSQLSRSRRPPHLKWETGDLRPVRPNMSHSPRASLPCGW